MTRKGTAATLSSRRVDMPIYEYSCKKCGSDFELLVNSDSKIACSTCGSERVSRKLSLFAVNTAPSNSVPQCACGGFEKGQCGSGMCGVN